MTEIKYIYAWTAGMTWYRVQTFQRPSCWYPYFTIPLLWSHWRSDAISAVTSMWRKYYCCAFRHRLCQIFFFNACMKCLKLSSCIYTGVFMDGWSNINTLTLKWWVYHSVLPDHKDIFCFRCVQPFNAHQWTDVTNKFLWLFFNF